VIMKQKRPGSTKVRSLGPYIFESYGGKLGVNATITNALGKRYFVSAANLLPFRGTPSTPQVQPDEDDSLGELLDESDAPPPGAIVLGRSPSIPEEVNRMNKSKSLLRYTRRLKKN
jgi:hypothetical protein